MRLLRSIDGNFSRWLTGTQRLLNSSVYDCSGFREFIVSSEKGRIIIFELFQKIALRKNNVKERKVAREADSDLKSYC